MRCINLYPEKSRVDGPRTLPHIPRPGLSSLSVPPIAGVGRGVFRTSRGQGYCVVGQNVYSISPINWSLTKIGSLQTPLTNLCSLTDNGMQGVLVDNSSLGYQFAILDGSGFAQISDPTNTFVGSIKVDYLDTFILWALRNSIEFGSTLSNVIQFDPTFVAGKTGYPDFLQTLFVNRHQLILFGEVRSEIWYDAGNPLFPFALLPGAYIEWGIVAPRSVAAIDNDVYWLGQGFGGIGLVIRQRGYETRVISNPAISYAITQMIASGADISDAIGNCYTQEGHVFFVLTFVTGNQTWVFDATISDPDSAWHQRAFSTGAGVLQRERACSYAFLNGKNVVQDWQNGTLYELDLDHYTDDVDESDGKGPWAHPISRTRTFPQLSSLPGFPPVEIAYKRIRINSFWCEFEGGWGSDNTNDQPPQIGLRLSFDRGVSYGNFVLQSTGEFGQFGTLPAWSPLGIGRFPVLELNWSYPGKASLGGGWIEAEVNAS